MTQNSGRSAGVFLRPEPSETGSGTSGNVRSTAEGPQDHKCRIPELLESQEIKQPYIGEPCHADTYDITPTTQITPRPDPPERTLGSRDQTHVEPPVRKRHMRTCQESP